MIKIDKKAVNVKSSVKFLGVQIDADIGNFADLLRINLTLLLG